MLWGLADLSVFIYFLCIVFEKLLKNVVEKEIVKVLLVIVYR